MNLFQFLSFIAYGIVAILLGVVGILYLLAKTIMPYHLEAIGKPWNELGVGMQAMLLNFMKSAALGFLTCALSIAALLVFCLRETQVWVALALGGIVFFELIGIMIRMRNVRRISGAKNPLQFQYFLLRFAAIGFLCSLPGTL